MRFNRLAKILLCIMILSLSSLLCACGATKDTDTSSDKMFTDRDYDTSYSKSGSTIITLSDDGTKVKGSGAAVSGSTVTISEEGTYIISGTLSDGQVVVNTDDTEKVQIVLDNASISCSTSCAIYVKQADKVFVTLAEDSDNTLASTGSYESIDESNIDGAIFSKCDLTLNGEGTLEVTASKGHGIVSKDDLKITSGTYTVTGAEHALQGKDSVRIGGGTITLNAGEDGIHSENEDKADEGKGFVYICEGTLQITAGDDGIHGGVNATVAGGTITITKCYEGLEAQTITISDGNLDITASDDGMNAASGETTNSNDPMASDDSCTLEITGGTIHIDASGDGIDSNGTLSVSGGSIYVDGPTNGGNGALDYGSSASITGGTIIAVGSSDMAENFTDADGQAVMLVNVSGNAGDTITVKDSSGKEVLSYTASKSFQCAVISSPDIQQGETYTVSSGSSSQTVEMTNSVYGSGGMMGGMPGSQMPGGQGGPGGQPGPR